MHELAHGPAAFAVGRVELRVAETCDRSGHFRWRRSNLLNRWLSPRGRHLRGHRKISNRVPRIHVVFSWSNLVFPCTIAADICNGQCRLVKEALQFGRLYSESQGCECYNTGLVSGGRGAESNGWRKLKCTTSSSSAAAAPV